MKTIAFIGVGVMGGSMVRNLMKQGYEVSIHTRTKSRALDVISEGAAWCDDVRSCVAGKDAVITIVGYPKDVEQVYFGPEGILENAAPGAYVIDMTTTSPRLSQRIYGEAGEKGLSALDAPVSGGDVGAQKGTLSIMVGGDREAFDACRGLFSAMGTNVVYAGRAGAGQHTKMANQIAIAGTIAGVCEALIYARMAGLDGQALLESIGAGAARSWQLSSQAPKIFKGDFAPGFFMKHFIKDMRIAIDEAGEKGVQLGVLETVCAMYEQLEPRYGDLGTQALYKYYAEKA